ncbi:lipid IV(A) 3-deoxy-D-manno-octulosonic acid transferase [Povalibacter sp.]|uniref:lipid IV(A) 3-deoxy-D-manno-octulosonic acid transferase n=1 Tax=Povalibacter sp. TaxID=1962978 RepID=UPI002F3F572D
MLRLIYTALLYVAAPLAFAVLLWRGMRDPLYRDRRGERFGFSRTKLDASIWVHAVSVGEVQAAAALIRDLQRRFPQSPLIVTTATPTGAQRVRALFPQGVHHAYLPYDLPGAVRRFLERIRPRIAVILETEVWPNLYRECGRRQIPIVLASARLSEKSVRRFRRIAGLFRDALNQGLVIGAQTRSDADRFIVVGAAPARTHVTGNIKFDLETPVEARARGEALRTGQFPGRFVWVAGSTHEGEEDVILEAHRGLLAARADSLLILVPRHPNRFERVRQWLSGQQVTFACRSRGEAVTPDTQILLADTLGELLMLYAAADVAFVGGSLVPIGGHNLLEPAALARPILTGPQNFNAPDIARLMLESGAALQVESAPGLAQALADLAANPGKRSQMGQVALAMLESNRGALARVMALVEETLHRRAQ